jgi:hypothetical protein
MPDELISELQREWREQVLIRLNNLAEGQEKINEKISTLENTFARESRLEKIINEQQLVNNNLQDRITKLEGIYMKALGAGFVIQVIFGAVIAFLTHK